MDIEDIKLVQQIKTLVSKLSYLEDLSLDTDYIIIETDGAVLKAKPNQYSTQKEEKLCGYASGKFKEKENISSIDAELLGNKGKYRSKVVAQLKE